VTQHQPQPTRTLPHDPEAEALVLASCLRSREALDVVAPMLGAEHFQGAVNAMVYGAMLELHTGHALVDVVTVARVLRDRGQLGAIEGEIDGLYRLARLAPEVTDSAVPIVDRVEAYARIVRDKAQIRAVIVTCQGIAAAGFGDVGSTEAFIDRAEQSLYELARPEARSAGRSLGEALRDRWAAYSAAAESGALRAGLVTGFPKLDAKLIELAPGDVTVIAARPGMGKSALANSLAVNAASPRTIKFPDPEQQDRFVDVDAYGFGVVMFSLEMPETQLVDRFCCAEAHVDGNRFRAGALIGDDWNRMTKAGVTLSNLPIWIHDVAAATLLEIRAAVRRRQAQYDREATREEPGRRVGLVIIDYLQLMGVPRGLESRDQQIGYLSRGLKVLAKELHVHVVVLSQLNRAVETRSVRDKRPQLSDLRESGNVEQDADNVLLIYRPELYFKGKHPGLAEIIVAKQRNGPTGSVWLKYAAYCTRFDHCAEEEYPHDSDTGVAA
jgi:replicative DNA helicase